MFRKPTAFLRLLASSRLNTPSLASKSKVRPMVSGGDTSIPAIRCAPISAEICTARLRLSERISTVTLKQLNRHTTELRGSLGNGMTSGGKMAGCEGLRTPPNHTLPYNICTLFATRCCGVILGAATTFGGGVFTATATGADLAWGCWGVAGTA